MFFPPVFCRVVSAVFYGLESFSRKVLSEATKEGTTCTERLQEWNRPRSKKCAPKKASEMDFRKSSLGKQLKESRTAVQSRPKHTAAELTDPRPKSKRGKVQARVDQVLEETIAEGRMNCLALAAGSSADEKVARAKRLARAEEQKKRWLQQHQDLEKTNTLPPSTSPDMNTDTDSESGDSDTSLEGNQEDQPLSGNSAAAKLVNPAEAVATQDDFFRKNIVVTVKEAALIEEETRQQSQCARWFDQRRLRVTATMCKDIACRRTADMQPLVQRKMRQTTFSNEATRYGLEHEEEALEEYTTFMQESGSQCAVQASGLIISVDHPYIACSPDGIVTTSAGKGLVEVKCPFRCRQTDISHVASTQRSFFLEKIGDGELRLKRSHKYYYL